jgi:hypothetical protein
MKKTMKWFLFYLACMLACKFALLVGWFAALCWGTVLLLGIAFLRQILRGTCMRVVVSEYHSVPHFHP